MIRPVARNSWGGFDDRCAVGAERRGADVRGAKGAEGGGVKILELFHLKWLILVQILLYILTEMLAIYW